MTQACTGCTCGDNSQCSQGQEYDVSSFAYEVQVSANYDNAYTNIKRYIGKF